MPYINVSVTKTLSEEQKVELANGLGCAMEKIPGKDKHWITVDIEDGKTMYTGGVKEENMVFADVRYFSNFDYHIKKAFTIAALEVFHKVLGTAKDKAMLTITEFNNWGAMGNFKDEYYSEE